MSLKTDFYDGSTGLLQKCDEAFTAGSTFVSTNLVTISNGLKTQAALGITTFKITILTSYSNTALRGNSGNNLQLKSYLAGITDGLAGQNIYSFEVTPTLNVSDSITTSIDFNFHFQTM